MRPVLGACILLVTLAVIALTLYGFATKAEARRILEDFYTLRVGVSSAAEVSSIVEKHKAHLSWTECRANSCSYFFEVTNNWLSRVRVEPAARFQAWVVVENGMVHNLHLEVQRETRIFPTSPSGGIVDESLVVPEYYRSGDPHYSFPTPIGKPYLRVAIDAKSTPEQRRRVYALSLTCLVKPGGGCDLPCDYLPLAWKDWESETASVPATVGSFGDYYPNRSRCK